MKYIQDQLEVAELKGIWWKIQPHLKSSIKLNPGSNYNKGNRSKIGGSPDGTIGFQWPINTEGEHLSFIAQIDLEGIKPFDQEDLLPHHGILYFFYDAYYQPSGYDNEHRYGWKVLYGPRGPYGTIKIPPPPELQVRNNETEDVFEKLIFSELTLDFHPEYTLPPYESEFIRSLELDFDSLWKYERLYFELVNQKPRYRMLGFPDRKMVNTNMIAVCQIAANGTDYYQNPYNEYTLPGPLNKQEEWILLLQVDSDLEVGMAWGGEELGRIYFWIRKQDLLERNFDRCWVVLEGG